MLACARDGVSLFVKQALDAHHALDVALAIHALTGAALHGLELGKLGFPEAQDVGREAAEAGHFTDAEIQLLRDQDFTRLARFAVLLLRTHTPCERWRPLRKKGQNFCLSRF